MSIMLKEKILFLWIFWLTASSSTFAQFHFRYEQDIPIVAYSDTLRFAWAGGINSGIYNTIDLNNDELLDLVILDRTSNRILTFLNEGRQYTYDPTYASLFPSDVKHWMLLVDYNCDGEKDLFTGSGSQGMKVYLNSTKEGQPLSWKIVANPLKTVGFSGFNVSLLVGSSDIPAISDIDGDDDLDVIVYNVNGRGNLEYYQNQSVEQHGHCDFLKFEAVDRRWGGVQECECNYFAFGTQDCEDTAGGGRLEENAKEQHIGGKSILAVDIDGDLDKDLLIGHEECSELYFLANIGSAENARFESFDNQFPDEVNPANFFVYPTAFYEDVDLDGVKDLIVTPNASINVLNSVDFTASNWLYKNTHTNEKPAFSLSTRTFLQEEMIDVGENAVPAFADFDADGDLDLFLSSRGTIQEDGFYAGIILYENTGTPSKPAFTLNTIDFAGLSKLKLHEVKVYFTDLNGDALPEMIITGAHQTSTGGILYIFENQETQPFQFQFDENNAKTVDFNFNLKDNFAFYDVDKDGVQDLFLGKQNGNLEYYHNSGKGLNPVWILESENVGDIKASISNLFVSPIFYDLDQNGEVDLISTDISGKLLIRPDFITKIELPQPIRVDTAYLVDNKVNSEPPVKLSEQTWLAAVDLFNDGEITLFVGGREGGVTVLKLNFQHNEQSTGLVIYPNPSDNKVIIEAKNPIKTLQVMNAGGQVLFEDELSEPDMQMQLDIHHLPAGLYLIRVFPLNGKILTGKLIVSQ